jgi:diguanylate cyclase (GGDEF)-like protein
MTHGCLCKRGAISKPETLVRKSSIGGDVMKKTVLVVDDDKDFRALVRPVLEDKGLAVVEAEDGASAKDLLSRERFDLLILDALLPDTDGGDWLAAQRAKGIKVPTVFVTGYWHEPTYYKRLTDELSVTLVLHKPIVPVVFANQIAGVLQAPESPKAEEQQQQAVDQQRKEKVDALAKVAAKFKAELPPRIEQMRTTIAKVKENPSDWNLVGEVRFAAHKIRGVAGSVGLQEIGKIMGQIEDRIVALDHNKALPPDLPLSFEELAARAATLLPGPGEAEGNGDQKQLQKLRAATIATVLIADDDPTFLQSIEKIGRQRLIEVITAANAKEALAQTAKHSIDAAILDVRLAGDEGSFELAGQLRELSKNERLPFAFLSGSAHVFNRVAAAHAGASLYLTKPLDPDTFESSVQKLVSVRRQEKARILVVDDDQNLSDLVAAVLEHAGMEVHTLNDPVRVLEAIQEVNPELILLDIMMPGISGFDVCKMLRTVGTLQELPIIFLTAETGMETRVACFRAGGDDYLPKPFAEEELLARVNAKLERVRLQQEHTEKDAMTGLLLRRSFMERAEAMLAAAQRQKFAVTLALMDLDHFNTVNETHGNQAGDTALSGFSRLLAKRFNMEDLRGRWGGDVFIAALQGVGRQEIHGAVGKLIAEFNATLFPSDQGSDFNVSVSAGLAAFPRDGQSLNDLVKAADRRLSLAKSCGGNVAVGED